jgi:hypothetical protein
VCKNAQATAYALFSAAEPEFDGLLTLVGVATTPAGQAAETAYDNALADLKNWTPGTTDTEIIELIGDVNTEFQALPLPQDAKTLAGLITGAITAVLGILNANTTAPAAVTAAPELAEHIQTLHAHAVATDTETKVFALTGYRPSMITKAKVMMGDHGAIASEWKNQWKKGVAESDPKYASLAA